MIPQKKQKKYNQNSRIIRDEISNNKLQEIIYLNAIKKLKEKIITDQKWLLFFLNVCHLLRETDFTIADIQTRMINLDRTNVYRMVNELTSVKLLTKKLQKQRKGFEYHTYGINEKNKFVLEELRGEATRKFNELIETGEIYNEK